MEPIMQRTSYASTAGSYDAGLRAYMLSIYRQMTIGLALTGLVAWLVANTALYNAIFGSGLAFVVMLAPLGFMFFLQFKWQTLSLGALRGTFYAFSGIMGLSMATIFAAFANEDIARAFFITAATFGAMSLWGYTTKRDLTAMGGFLFMGLVGILIASLVNIFLASSALQWAVSVIGVLVFTGLTAFDTQRLKMLYMQGYGEDATARMGVMGALSLYLNFINLFQLMLSLMGSRRN